MTAEPGEWSIFSIPPANTKATATQAAGAAGVRHVCRSIAFTAIGNGAAAAVVGVDLLDGAATIWGVLVLIPVTGTVTFAISGLNIFGSAATAMTLQFSGAGGANTNEALSLTGYDTI